MTPLQKLREWVYSIDVTMVSTDVLLEKIEQLMPEERDMVVSAWDSSITWVDGEDITGDIYFTQKYGSNGKAD